MFSQRPYVESWLAGLSRGLCRYALTAVLMFFLAGQQPLHCQKDSVRLEILKGINAYRSHLFNDHVTDRLYLGKVISKLLDKDYSEQELLHFSGFLGSYYLSKTQPGYPAPTVYSGSCTTILLDSLTDLEFQILLDNADIFDIMMLDVLEVEYPYKFKPNAPLINEIAFYNIRQGDTLADIGAGNGEFGIVVASVYDSLCLSLTELSPERVLQMRVKTDRLKDFLADDNMNVIQGSADHCKLPENRYHKIILRNALHHFEFKGSMLKSVRKALKEDGTLYVFEKVRGGNVPGICTRAMRANRIIRVVERNGFRLDGRQALESGVVFKFEKIDLIDNQ